MELGGLAGALAPEGRAGGFEQEGLAQALAPGGPAGGLKPEEEHWQLPAHLQVIRPSEVQRRYLEEGIKE